VVRTSSARVTKVASGSYPERSPDQLQALKDAKLDSDVEFYDNAVRALMVLSSADDKMSGDSYWEFSRHF
jgi:hypothetical protein